MPSASRPSSLGSLTRFGPAKAASVAAVVALALAGCGGEQAGGAPGGSSQEEFAVAEGASVVGEDAAGQVLQYADCYDWEDGSVDQRQATVVQLREQLTPQGAEDPDSPLADSDAYEKLDGSCEAGPKSLRLYKLYVRMQALGSLEDRLDEG